MRAINKQLKILSEAEISALYEIPDFDYEQRLEYLTLTDKELQLALSYKNLSDKVHCILQIGYFKAVKMFYRIDGMKLIQTTIYLLCNNISKIKQ